jgi:hypothetical protein
MLLRILEVTFELNQDQWARRRLVSVLRSLVAAFLLASVLLS